MLDLFKLPPHLLCKMCVCFFLSSSPPLSFNFMFSPFFSKVIQLHAEQRGEKITVLRNKSARHVIKDNVPFVTFYSSVFFSPTHFHLALLHVWQYLIISVILLLRRKKKVRQFPVYAIFHVIFLRVTDTPPGDWGEQSNPLPLTEASNPASPEGLR